MSITISANGKKTVQFVHKTIDSTSIKIVTSLLKLTPNVATIDVQDDLEVVIVTEDDEIT